MTRRITITALVENKAGPRGTLGEHGLSLWIETESMRILFDTGQGMALEHNAERLGIKLLQADAVILSHGHYDHTGGLKSFMQTVPGVKVYAHPGTFKPKYARNDDGTGREAGMPSHVEGTIRQKAGDLVLNTGTIEIGDGLFSTGEIPRRTPFEDTGGPFFLDSNCTRPDALIDDQALFFDSQKGTVVLLGCAHAGVINTLRHVEQLTGGKPIYCVVGGMHLGSASRERMEQTLDGFRRLMPALLAPAHCTGMEAMVQLWTAFPGKCISFGVGAGLEIA